MESLLLDQNSLRDHQHITIHPDFKPIASKDKNLLTLFSWGLDQALLITGACAGSFFLSEDNQKTIVWIQTREWNSGNPEEVQIPIGYDIADWVAQQHTSVLIQNLETDKQFSEIINRETYPGHSYISVPLGTTDKFIGVLNITRKKDALNFTESDVKRSEALAAFLSRAYEQQMRLDQIREENNQAKIKIEEYENTLKQQEALADLGKLVSHLAHELGNPLDAARRYANLAIDQVPEESPAREYLLKTKMGIRRCIQVIRGLLQLTRNASRSACRTSEIHETIEKSLELFRIEFPSKGIQIEKEFSDGHLHVPDAGLVEVFLNLFKNAAQAMSGIGKIRITTKHKSDIVSIVISDTGPGVPELIKNRLFEPFFTTKNDDGTGLGLTIAREIIERSEGEIHYVGGNEISHDSIKSPMLNEFAAEAPLEGACFQLLLPKRVSTSK